MKTFTIHSVRNVFAFFIALGLGYMAYTVSPTSVTGPKVEATSAENVSGYAWSDNIGWISFNDTTGGNPAQPYGVKINTTSGDISGIAWSSGVDSAVGPQGFVEGGIGAISFNRADTGNPPGDPYQTTGAIARVNITTGAVTGWARALSACDPTCATNSGAGANSGGWDGWVKLSKDPSDTGSTYGVVINAETGKFSGYAWGGAQVDASGNSTPSGVSVVGWISFNCSTDGSCGSSNYFVQGPELNCTNLANNPPTCTQCPDGQFYNTISSQCYPCSGTGCNGTGGTTSPGNEFGSLSCNGGTTNVPGCNACPQLEVLVGNSCENSIGNGTCDIDAGENLTNSPDDCKPKTRFWQF